MSQRGFTLIELIVSIVVATIVMGFSAMFIGAPVQTYIAQTRRATLNDSADAITRNIAWDVRSALPNSTRAVSNGTFFALEMMSTTNVLRYRAEGEGPGVDSELKPTTADSKFATLGQVAAPFNFYAVVNQATLPDSVYGLVGVMAPGPGTLVYTAATDETSITLAAPFNYANSSPSLSVFLVSGPVSFICDGNAGTLYRYSGYNPDASQANRDSDAELMGAGATRALIATDVTACQASRTSATKWRGDLVTLRIMLSNSGDNLPVLYVAQVGRRP
jgi:MSHA biogenesis protein MshO